MNLLLTTYLTKKGNPQGGEAYKPNNYELMSAWHQSVTSLDCDTIIIHDELSNDFTNEYEMRYYDPTFV